MTEQGEAWGAGHDWMRSIFAHKGPQYITREPAYKLEIPGRAIKCWANKYFAMGFVEVEDNEGHTRVFSGNEILQQNDLPLLKILG